MNKGPVRNRAFPSIPVNERDGKPRSVGLTEVRGPIYTVIGPRYLEDLIEVMGPYIDIFKFGGAAFALMEDRLIRELIQLCHDNGIKVSTGGSIETVLRHGPEAVKAYLHEAREFEFDVVELSTGFLSMPLDDLVRLVRETAELGMMPKPEINVQFGAGGTSVEGALERMGTIDLGWAVHCAHACLEAGAPLVMLESEGVTESVTEWRTDVPARMASELGLERVMFEAADPEVYSWYVKQFGPEVNLFVDHSQIINLESLRSGLWGNGDLWGRVVTYKG